MRIEEIKPIKDEIYTPKIEGADEEIRRMSYEKARRFTVITCRKSLKNVWKKS